MSNRKKVLAYREYLKQQKKLNKERALAHKEKMKQLTAHQDPRSTKETFLQWCEECTNNQLFPYEGVLSIMGSDGIRISDDKLGDAPFNCPEAVDRVLEEEGYYDSDEVMCGQLDYTAPKVHYLEWFNKKFNVN